MNLKEKEWEISYQNKDNFVFYPHEEIIRFTAKYVAKRKGFNQVEYHRNGKVLDLGCGIGRHIIFFENLGIDAYGVDLSKEAIEMAKKWLIDTGHIPLDTNKLYQGSAEALPWVQNDFDFIVSHGVLDSMPFAIARNIVKECSRVLKDDGLFYCDLISDETKYGNQFDEEVLVEEEHEKGTIQSYFTIDKINRLVENLFEIQEINKITNQNMLTQNYYSRYHLVLKKVIYKGVE